MRVLIANAVLANTGDAAILEAIVDSIRGSAGDVAIDFTIQDSHAAATTELYPQYAVIQHPCFLPPNRRGVGTRVRVLLSRLCLRFTSTSAFLARAATKVMSTRSALGATLSAIQAADVVVSTGGTYLVDQYEFSGRVHVLRTSKRLGREVVLWTQSMGPFRDRRHRGLIRRMAPDVDAVYFRDERSRRSWLRVAALPDRHAVVPDAAFALAPTYGAFARNARALDTPSHGTGIALSLRDWQVATDGSKLNSRRFLKELGVALSRQALPGTARLPITAVSTCQGIESYSYDDSEVALAIARSHDLVMEVDRQHHTPSELVERLAAFNICVGMRMHFCILSLLAGSPTIAIAYEFKTIELYRSLGLQDFCIAIEDFNAQWLTDRMAHAQRRPDDARVTASQLVDLASLARHPAAHLTAAWC